MKILQLSNISIPFLCLVDALFCILFKQIFKIHFTTNNIFDMRCFYRALNDNQSYLPCRSATVRKQLKTKNFYNQIFKKIELFCILMTHNRKEDRSIVRDKTLGWVSGWVFALRAGDRGLNPCRDKPRPISKLWKQELRLFDIWWRLQHRTVMLCKVSWVMIFFNSCIPYIFNDVKTSIQLHIVLNLWSCRWPL